VNFISIELKARINDTRDQDFDTGRLSKAALVLKFSER
jgi:hypothetical protein